MKVKVWNDNKHPHTEVFKGERISIGPGQFIEMEEDDAVSFKGSYTPILTDFDNRPLESSYKMIRIEKLPQEKKSLPKEEMYYCQACGKIEHSKKDLENHIDQNHLDQLDDQKLAEKRRRKKSEDAA